MEQIIREKLKEAVKFLYNCEADDSLIQIQETRKEFTGDFTFVVFPILRYSKNTPEQTGESIGNWLKENLQLISGYNVIKGFLNLIVSEKWWLSEYKKFSGQGDVFSECKNKNPETILVEYSSPNTNKPLHLGHIRNNFWVTRFTEFFQPAGIRLLKPTL